MKRKGLILHIPDKDGEYVVEIPLEKSYLLRTSHSMFEALQEIVRREPLFHSVNELINYALCQLLWSYYPELREKYEPNKIIVFEPEIRVEEKRELDQTEHSLMRARIKHLITNWDEFTPSKRVKELESIQKTISKWKEEGYTIPEEIDSLLLILSELSEKKPEEVKRPEEKPQKIVKRPVKREKSREDLIREVEGFLYDMRRTKEEYGVITDNYIRLVKERFEALERKGGIPEKLSKEFEELLANTPIVNQHVLNLSIRMDDFMFKLESIIRNPDRLRMIDTSLDREYYSIARDLKRLKSDLGLDLKELESKLTKIRSLLNEAKKKW